MSGCRLIFFCLIRFIWYTDSIAIRKEYKSVGWGHKNLLGKILLSVNSTERLKGLPDEIMKWLRFFLYLIFRSIIFLYSCFYCSFCWPYNSLKKTGNVFFLQVAICPLDLFYFLENSYSVAKLLLIGSRSSWEEQNFEATLGRCLFC